MTKLLLYCGLQVFQLFLLENVRDHLKQETFSVTLSTCIRITLSKEV